MIFSSNFFFILVNSIFAITLRMRIRSGSLSVNQNVLLTSSVVCAGAGNVARDAKGAVPAISVSS